MSSFVDTLTKSFKAVNFTFVVINTLVFSFLAYFLGLRDNLEIVISIILFLSILFNPPTLMGFILFMKLRRQYFRVIVNLKRNQKTQKLSKRFLSRHRSTIKSIDRFGRISPDSIFVAHKLYEKYLIQYHTSRFVNATDTFLEEHNFNSKKALIEYLISINKYVSSFLFSKSGSEHENLLIACLDTMPASIQEEYLREIIMDTHNDGDGFLSTLIAFYNSIALLLLPLELRNKVSRVCISILNEKKQLGWLSHRIFEYVLYSFIKNQSCSEEQLKIKIIGYFSNYNGTVQSKYEVRNLLKSSI